MRPPHQRGGFDAVGEPRRVDHLGHLNEAAIEPPDSIGNRAFQLDLARGHRAGSELVLQANDPVVIGRAVIEPSRHQKQADTTRAVDRALRPRQQHHHFRVCVGAEPFFARQPPVMAFLHSGRGECADVGAAFLFGHELAALGQLAHIGLREAIQISRLQRLAAEIRKQLGAAIGDIDRAPQTELGLIEQKRKGVLGNNRVFLRPAQNALAKRHRMYAELAKRGTLEFAIGRMIFDPLDIAAKAVALMQHRHVPVGEPGTFVETTARERAQPVEMRLDMAEQRVGKMDAKQIRQRRIGAIKIQARGVGGKQARPVGGICSAIMHEWLH
ncbi:hypothetical protein GALL_534860 [mine drainage metagenome]|uniref:Uncharacterized protein n=1 Tax=mine drainage metagenome TaxID=410659 RepID=A0A1J5P090_9ZZZZ